MDSVKRGMNPVAKTTISSQIVLPEPGMEQATFLFSSPVRYQLSYGGMPSSDGAFDKHCGQKENDGSHNFLLFQQHFLCYQTQITFDQIQIADNYTKISIN